MISAKITSKGMITLPKVVREKLNLKEGMRVAFIEVDEGYLLVPIKPLEESFGDGGRAMLEIAREVSKDRMREKRHDESEL